MYSAYMNEFKVAMKTLARYEQGSREFREALKACQHSSSCEGLSLAAYLLTPIQRLPRYELLLKVCRRASLALDFAIQDGWKDQVTGRKGTAVTSGGEFTIG